MLKRDRAIRQALFLSAPFWSKKENVHLFSSLLPRFDKCHETSRIFPRTEQTFASARSFGVISWASFSRKNGPFGFGRAPSASQKALSKSKGTFLRENECAKWYQNFGNVKICGRQRGIFVIDCAICQGLDKKQISGNLQLQNFLPNPTRRLISFLLDHLFSKRKNITKHDMKLHSYWMKM